MTAQLTQDHFDAIKSAMDQYDVRFWGLRVDFADAVFDENAPLARSRHWVDGIATEQLLSGTSVVGVTDSGRPLVSLNQYITAYLADAKDQGRQVAVRVMLVGSNSAELGEDDGEYILADAYCYWSTIL